jgi:RHH-type transcriptional regulator, proline utilization regulon repressor / proline dehydrogenase / delta 1-pyrroline-5-carboxylate dehydrogenase
MGEAGGAPLLCADRHRRPLLTMMAGAMVELVIGDPAVIATDIGPVIDAAAREALEAHAARMEREGRLPYRCALPLGSVHGTFFAPQA